MFGSRQVVVLGIFALLLLRAGASAAQDYIDLERFQPAFDPRSVFGVQSPRAPGAWNADASLWFSWMFRPLVLRQGELRTPVIEDRLQAHLNAQIGLWEHFAFGLHMPVVLFQDARATPLLDGGHPASSFAAGDPRLMLRAQFLGKNAPRQQQVEGLGLGLLFASTIPAGKERAFAGEEGATTQLQFLGDFGVLGAAAGWMLGWTHRFEASELLQRSFRDELQLGVSLKVPIPRFATLHALGELRLATDARAPFSQASTTATEGDLGLGYGLGDFYLRVALGAGMGRGVGSPALRGLLGVSWSPRSHDADRDGVPDERDQCPHLPEDRDGFEDEDGCLDPDNDGDLIPDKEDRCPNKAALEGQDRDNDGCTDAPGGPAPAKPREDDSPFGGEEPAAPSQDDDTIFAPPQESEAL